MVTLASVGPKITAAVGLLLFDGKLPPTSVPAVTWQSTLVKVQPGTLVSVTSVSMPAAIPGKDFELGKGLLRVKGPSSVLVYGKFTPVALAGTVTFLMMRVLVGCG